MFLGSRHRDWNLVASSWVWLHGGSLTLGRFRGVIGRIAPNQCWMSRKDCRGHAMLMAFAGRWRACATGADRIEWLRFEPSAGTRESGIAVFSSSDSNHILTPGWNWGSLPPMQSLDGVTPGGKDGLRSASPWGKSRRLLPHNPRACLRRWVHPTRRRWFYRVLGITTQTSRIFEEQQRLRRFPDIKSPNAQEYVM